MLKPGDLLQDRYRIASLLGSGGMGSVYEAIDIRIDKNVAVKQIIGISSKDPKSVLLVEAFEREAKSLVKANHEFIPDVTDYFSERDSHFLVMELIEGEDLATLLERRNEPFSIDEIMQWIRALLDVLDHLHNLDPPIFHRDIKPLNIKIDLRQKIKLLDFGIAKRRDAGKTTGSDKTLPAATRGYSPIEQIFPFLSATDPIMLRHGAAALGISRQKTDARADIYALGATLYELLTGARPTDADKRFLALLDGKTDVLPAPHKLNENIPSGISVLIMKALEVHREDRFGSVSEMKYAFEKIIPGETSSTLKFGLGRSSSATSSGAEKSDLTIGIRTGIGAILLLGVMIAGTYFYIDRASVGVIGNRPAVNHHSSPYPESPDTNLAVATPNINSIPNNSANSEVEPRPINTPRAGRKSTSPQTKETKPVKEDSEPQAKPMRRCTFEEVRDNPTKKLDCYYP